MHVVQGCLLHGRHKSQLQDYLCEEMGLVSQCTQFPAVYSSLRSPQQQRGKRLHLAALMTEKAEDVTHCASLYYRTDMCFTAQQAH